MATPVFNKLTAMFAKMPQYLGTLDQVGFGARFGRWSWPGCDAYARCAAFPFPSVKGCAL